MPQSLDEFLAEFVGTAYTDSWRPTENLAQANQVLDKLQPYSLAMVKSLESPSSPSQQALAICRLCKIFIDGRPQT